tara:strand:- start:4709 stop:5020 length:312 start_codon:yes stop_codon:yes gene_type:complete
MIWIKRLFSKKETTEQCDIHVVSSSLKHTMTLGLMLPIFIKDGNKPNYQILNINYNCSDGRGDLVRVTLGVGTKVDVIEISTQEAVDLGFINPYGLKDYCRHH